MRGNSVNEEHPYHKTGLIGEYLVKIKLNDYGINTGSVDKDTGTDIVMFRGDSVLTAQVKSGYQKWNTNADIHNVNVHFKVNLHCTDDNVLLLDESEIQWRRIDVDGSVFKNFDDHSIEEMFV